MSNTHSPPVRRSILLVRQENPSGPHHCGSVSAFSQVSQAMVRGAVSAAAAPWFAQPLQRDCPVPHGSPVGSLPPYPWPTRKAAPLRPAGCARPCLRNRPSPELPIASRHWTRPPRSSRCAQPAATPASYTHNGCQAGPQPCRARFRAHPPGVSASRNSTTIEGVGADQTARRREPSMLATVQTVVRLLPA